MNLIKLNLLVLVSSVTLVASAQQSDAIKVNEVGYYPQGPKTVVVTGEQTGDRFFVLRAEQRDTVYKGVFGSSKSSAYSSLKQGSETSLL